MLENIKHFVYLLLENQSFDRLLGCFREVYPELEGLNRPGTPLYFNRDDRGAIFEQRPSSTKQVTPDPKHEARFVLEQIADQNGGFVLDFAKNYPSSTAPERQEIMCYYPLDFLPALHTLARNFTICDHWFSSLPGPTWPNRFFALTGTCNGQALMPEGWKDAQLKTYIDQTQDTIFDRLNERGIPWHVYYYDFPSSLLLTHQRRPENLIHYHPIAKFYEDCRYEAQFPPFAFIEPKYFLEDQNDDHPPHNIFKGEKLIADVYNGIRSNPDLWSSTLLVIAFDEHGGFYDHVPPPGTVPPDSIPARIDPDDPRKVFGFDRLGVRVPALLVSPWVDKGFEPTEFDHTSFLALLTEKWSLGPLGQRTQAAKSLSLALRDKPLSDTPGFIRVSYTDLVPPDPALERQDSSKHHRALEAFAYAFAIEKGNLEFARVASLEPPAWLSAKGRVGNWLMSAGAYLSDDLQRFRKHKIEGIARAFESAISRSRNQT